MVFVAIGVGLHLPDFYIARSLGYRMVGMGFSPLMWTGMTLISLGMLIGFGSALLPPEMESAPAREVKVRVTALDDRPLGARDIAILTVLGFGLVIDIMKPATLGFVAPGARAEYGLTLWQVALWPLIALIGTAIGSILWGVLGDRIGRRRSVLLAALLFVGTSVCGAMPLYVLNLGMCLLMGLSAGGMLPLVFALLSEVVPRVHRGWLLVLLGCLTGAGGYLAASGAAALLEPIFGWRILWLIGLPTGALLVAFSSFIPESPRYLVRHGRIDEAIRQLKMLGAEVEVLPVNPKENRMPRGRSGLFAPRHRAQTAALTAFGLAWGLANFGLLTWLPTLLRHSGGGNRLLASAALVALPGSLVAPVLYSRWRTRASMLVYAAAIVLALVALSLAPVNGSLLYLSLIVLLLSSLVGTNAMLQIYSAEIYPTEVRASGAGAAAAATKFGGIIGPQFVALLLSLQLDVRTAAWMLAIPVAAATVAIVLTGRETGARPLDEISEEPVILEEDPALVQ